MRNILIILAAVFLFVLDQTLVPFFSLYGTYGSLVFTFFGLFALLSDSDDAILLAFVVGVLQDIYFPYAFGLNILLNLLLFLALSRAGETLKEGRKSMPVLFLALAQGIKNLMILLVLYLFGYKGNMASIVIAPLYTVAFALFLYNRVIAFKRIPMIKKEWKF